MNTRYDLVFLPAVCIIAVFFSSSVFASTILVNFENYTHISNSEGQDDHEGENGNLSKAYDLAEELLSQYLFQSGHKVITSNEVAPSQWLTEKEIREGRSGKQLLLRKMAALSDASVFFNAVMQMNETKEEYLGVQMSTNTLTISYKLVETASGDTIAIDSGKYVSAARTSGYARHSAIEKMAKDVAARISTKASESGNGKAEKELSKYKQQWLKEGAATSAVFQKGQKTSITKGASTPKTPSTAIVSKDEKPPEIFLIQPPVTRGFAVVSKKPKATINVAGVVRDDSSILYLRLNGSRTNLDSDGFFSESIAIDGQTEKIVIEAMDEPGNKVTKEFQLLASNDDALRGKSVSDMSIASGALKPALWGLSIGVSKYQSTMTDLKYADMDARCLSEFFETKAKQLYSEVHFKTLVNEQVTRDSIIDHISGHLGQAAPQDVVFIFMAGHGIKHAQTGSYYFMPHDVDANNLLSRGLRMSDFEESINILSENVGKLIIAMDTCHSGALNVNVRTASGGENLAEVLKASTGVYILAAAKGGEGSIEDLRFRIRGSDSGHGVFTYTLIEGMMGKANFDGNDYISVNELFQFVSKQVPRLTKGRQHPFIRSAGTDLPLVMLGQNP